MNVRILWIVAFATTVAGAAPTHATTITVTATGTVDYNQVAAPPLGNVNPGDAVELRFNVDSFVFVNSASYPTRGYVVDGSSFTFTLGSTVMALQDPFPTGQTPYFVLRDNDPAVDGFFLATSVDFPIGVPIDQTGAVGQFVANYSVTYGGDTLSSLDIVDALGTYDYTGLTVFHFTVDDGPFEPLGINFTEMVISADSVFEDGFESGDTSLWTLTTP
jgi:hypothetical protein